MTKNKLRSFGKRPYWPWQMTFLLFNVFLASFCIFVQRRKYLRERNFKILKIWIKILKIANAAIHMSILYQQLKCQDKIEKNIFLNTNSFYPQRLLTMFLAFGLFDLVNTASRATSVHIGHTVNVILVSIYLLLWIIKRYF